MLDTNKPKQPFISVIIVCYNYAQYLLRALEAVRNQSVQDYEIVMVNNGSTDHSQEIIDEFQKKYPEILMKKVYIPENKGLVNGRNQGIEAAEGKYILFNDADDWMNQNCLGLLCEKARQTDADVVKAAYEHIDLQGKCVRTVAFIPEQSCWLTCWLQATLFKNSIVKENNLRFHETWLDDIDFNVFFLANTQKVEYVDTPLYFYQVNPHSTSGAKIKKRSWNGIDLIRDALTLFYPLYEQLQNEKEKTQMEYMFIKQYYFYYLHYFRYVPYTEAIERYREANSLIIKYFPEYLHCPALTLSPNGDRKSGRYMTKLLSWCERYKLIGIFIFIYLQLNKVISIRG